MFAINPQARISLADLRIMIQAITSFTLTEQELLLAAPVVRDSVKKTSEAQREPTLTPGASHTLVARQITNLTAEDIERLESEARGDARDASLLQEQEARRSLFTDVQLDEDEDDDCSYPLFISPTFSPTPTIVVHDYTHRVYDRTLLLDVDPAFVIDGSDSDSDVDSDAPITPQSHPTGDDDVDIAVVPEIDLDDGGFQLHKANISTLLLTETQSSLIKEDVQDAQLEIAGRFGYDLSV